jgi:hypothetical protein
MSNPIVDSIISGLESGLIDAAKSAAVELKPQVVDNAKNFITIAYKSIERWVMKWSSGVLSTDQLKDLLADLLWDAVEHALTVLQRIEVQVDKTKNTLLSLVTGVASNVVGKLIVL